MRLGCSTILYGGHPLAAALDGIARAGYAAIELCAIPGMAPHLAPDAPLSVAADLRARIADLGLAVESLGASGTLGNLDQFEQLMRLGQAVGTPAITTGSGGRAGDDASFREVVTTMKRLAEIAAATGVVVSIKPHVGHAVHDSATALRFMGEVDPRYVGLNVDASHLLRAGEEPAAAIRALAPHVATARIRDGVRGIDGPGSVEQQIPGGGDLDMSALASAIGSLPRPSYAVLEIVGAKDLPLEAVQSVVSRAHTRLTELFAG
jgi:sugar phosphate isomerase/epimerase